VAFHVPPATALLMRLPGTTSTDLGRPDRTDLRGRDEKAGRSDASFRRIGRAPRQPGQRVVIRWRRPSPGDGEQIADVLGILEENDPASFAVRTSDGALVVIPAARALAGKVVPPAPQNRRRAGPAPP
jgi:hypothetical protein